ncbi:MAG: helix-turn-helix domain-containing protein [Proteobacteria bacterium]|nr:helix-turn-helix domain-containing protein [Pseudomonadota bacterium]
MKILIWEARRREKVVRRILNGETSKVQAARQLKLTTKTVYRLCLKYEEGGLEALISKKRPGMASNRRMSDGLREKVKTFVLAQREQPNFGPKTINVLLEEQMDINLSKETIRLWMIEWKLWRPRKRRKIKR